MTVEILIQKVREKHGALDADGEQIVAMAFEIWQSANSASSAQSSKESLFGDKCCFQKAEVDSTANLAATGAPLNPKNLDTRKRQIHTAHKRRRRIITKIAAIQAASRTQ
jgi:hypothetical protein